MPQAVWSSPVTRPASMPAMKAMRRASQGLSPMVMPRAATAPPVAREPSTVRSAMSRIRKVMYTPMAMMPQARPCPKAPGMELRKESRKSIGRYLQKVDFRRGRETRKNSGGTERPAVFAILEGGREDQAMGS